MIYWRWNVFGYPAPRRLICCHEMLTSDGEVRFWTLVRTRTSQNRTWSSVQGSQKWLNWTSSLVQGSATGAMVRTCSNRKHLEVENLAEGQQIFGLSAMWLIERCVTALLGQLFSHVWVWSRPKTVCRRAASHHPKFTRQLRQDKAHGWGKNHSEEVFLCPKLDTQDK